ncbi:MAG: UDP-4-amino-4,6-dideoxy-N-acetyl-beta-L-altrosamine transaminase [Parcubacteria group bacterium]|nr:UDP-4-amino-4,6-dideoxy-N-acetyl-beta-L-altrosamine transaminase [Parcubacteria group bacterium]
MKTIPYGHQQIDGSDIASVVRILKSDWITQGPRVEQFEQAIAGYCGVKYAVAFSSGTAALHAAYAAARIGPGDEVITTPMTFAATANAIVYCGGKPVFADIQENTLNISPEAIKKKITKRTKALAPVDFAGHPAELDTIKKIAREHNLLVIEDAAHALGSEYKGKKVGSFSDMTMFSFHPVKAITTGEGGMVVTDRKDFYRTLKAFRNHGLIRKPERGAWYYEIERPGYNYRISDIQCALGLSQFQKLDRFVKTRREIVRRYNQAFRNISEIILPVEKAYARSAYHLYPIRLRLELLKTGRRKIFEALRNKGLGVQVHYIPVHLHPFYKKTFGYKKGDFPIAEQYYERAITLPLFPKMISGEIRAVVRAVREIIARYRR